MSAAQNPPIENQLKSTENWYTSWFDSRIITSFTKIEIIELRFSWILPIINLPEKANVLDLACGKVVILFT
jgi:hypothetical protein